MSEVDGGILGKDSFKCFVAVVDRSAPLLGGDSDNGGGASMLPSSSRKTMRRFRWGTLG